MIVGMLGKTTFCAAMLLLSACSRSNNVFLGRVEATVGTHNVVVTDCYRTSVPRPRQSARTETGELVYRFTPCRDADVLIRGAELIVNGRSYGRLKRTDSILVDHSVVSIQP
jgi:hypothetical protein